MPISISRRNGPTTYTFGNSGKGEMRRTNGHAETDDAIRTPHGQDRRLSTILLLVGTSVFLKIASHVPVGTLADTRIDYETAAFCSPPWQSNAGGPLAPSLSVPQQPLPEGALRPIWAAPERSDSRLTGTGGSTRRPTDLVAGTLNPGWFHKRTT